MWVTPDDIFDRWIGGDGSVDLAVVETLISDAEDALEVAVPGLERMIGASIPEDRVRRVVARMVIRVLRNPDGVRTIQETTGQFSGSTTYAGDHLGEVTVTDADRRDLLGKAQAARRAFSTMPGGIR